MGNVLFDFNLFNSPTWMTYIGGGAGYVWNDWKNSQFIRGTTTYRIDDNDGRFAYQAIAGVAFNIAPGLALTAEYRFLGTLNPEDRHRPHRRPAARRRRGRLQARELQPQRPARPAVQFRRAAPPPVVAETPAPPRAPEIARTYLVFFDWDRSNLTDRARQIIVEAANNSRAARATRIEVAGHADRSGSRAVQPAPVAAPRRRRSRRNSSATA